MSNQPQSDIVCLATATMSNIVISPPKVNKSGGKNCNVINRDTKKTLMMSTNCWMLTWGINEYTDEKTGAKTYDVSLQFPGDGYNTPETDSMLEKIKEIEEKFKTELLSNPVLYFNKKTMSREVLDALWTPMLRYPKDKVTLDFNTNLPPTLRLKIPYYDGKFSFEIYNDLGNIVFGENDDNSPLDIIHKGDDIQTVFQFGGIWFANGKCGATIRILQAVHRPKPSIKGRCMLIVQPTPVAVASAPLPVRQDQSDNDLETGKEIEEDEKEIQSQEVITDAVACQSPQQTTVEVVAPSAPKKKTVVRKGN